VALVSKDDGYPGSKLVLLQTTVVVAVELLFWTGHYVSTADGLIYETSAPRSTVQQVTLQNPTHPTPPECPQS
jgi:hypothetical protein